jgi:hypothetical protein
MERGGKSRQICGWRNVCPFLPWTNFSLAYYERQLGQISVEDWLSLLSFLVVFPKLWYVTY